LHQNAFGGWPLPRPTGGAYSAPHALATFMALLLREGEGKEGKKGEKMGKKGRGGKERKGKTRREGREVLFVPDFKSSAVSLISHLTLTAAGCSGLVLTCLTMVQEIPGLNAVSVSKKHCDIQHCGTVKVDLAFYSP